MSDLTVIFEIAAAAGGGAFRGPGDDVGAEAAGDFCPCSSVVEHSLGKGEVMRSIRIMGTRYRSKHQGIIEQQDF